VALPLGYKTNDTRIFAYLRQNQLRSGYADEYRSPETFTARQRRRLRKKARSRGEEPGYPELERRWSTWKTHRRARDVAIARYGPSVRGAETEGACGVSYDHDWKQGDPECRRCGADLSEWND